MPKLQVARTMRILDFDIENRPLSYLGSDFTTAEVTAIAASFVGERKVYCWLLGDITGEEMLTNFVELYDQADIVTGHYIRRHDLPIINGALMDLDLGQLKPKLTSDTKCDLNIRSGISASQESLSDMVGIRASKLHMTQHMWREANRLTREGRRQTKRRVVGDIKQHKKLRAELVERGYLGPHLLWKP